MKQRLAMAIFAATMVWGNPASASDTARAVDAGDWWRSVQESIADSEYHVTWQERAIHEGAPAGWQAPNREQGLRTYFTPQGIRVVPRQGVPAAMRDTAKPTWEWGLSLIGVGRGAAVSPVRPATMSAYENRVSYDRGAIVEWYINDRDGLEQGFTLEEPPEVLAGAERSSQRDAPAFVNLELVGNLSPQVSPDGQAIDFVSSSGAKVVHYSKLKVFDALGHELRAWMEGFAEAGVRGVRIAYDDRDATYPVIIDPLATVSSWTTYGTQGSAVYGFDVATAGDVNGDGYFDVIVSAHLYDNGQTDEGRAYVYHGSSTGLSTAPAWITESNQEFARYGLSVSTAGDVNADGYADVVVGSYWYDNGQTNEGRAYVYHGSSTGLAETPAWTAEPNRARVEFGWSVGTAGDVNGDGYSDVIVGARRFDEGGTDAGRAYVYLGSASGLGGVAAWTVDGDQAGAQLGYSVSTAGDVDADGYADIIVGAFAYDNGQVDEGRALVYRGSAAGPSAAPSWVAESDQADALFGYSVSTAGDVNGDGYADVIVGALLYDSGNQIDRGRAYVYQGSPTGLNHFATWAADGVNAGARLGTVSTAGDVNGDGYADVIVGAHMLDQQVGQLQPNAGRAFVYHGSPTGLGPNSAWGATSGQADAHFGFAVSTAGDVNGDGYADVIVGGYLHDGSQTDEGLVAVFRGSSAGLAKVASWTGEANQENSDFGAAVSTAGDVNGDGYADVIVGAPEFDVAATNEGRAFVYHGSPQGLPLAPTWTARGGVAGAGFGQSVSTAGDVNGDGYADVIIGAHNLSNGQTAEGRACVFHGSSSGLSSAAVWTAEANLEFSQFGRSVSSAGDVNGDGYADVIVGAPSYNDGGAESGRVFVYHGSSSGLSPTEAWFTPNTGDDQFGMSVASAGDVDGDGYADVIIGAPSDGGRAFVYHGSATGLGPNASWSAGSGQSAALFGYSVSSAGDVNGDGYADVIVGAPGTSGMNFGEGWAFTYLGSPSGVEGSAHWSEAGSATNAQFGLSVSTAGDVNGDGYADVIVGSRSFFILGLVGGATVYHGSSFGLSFTARWLEPGNQNDVDVYAVSTAGDVNGDGYADVIVGARGDSNGEDAEGRAFVYYGGEGRGLALNPQQRQANDLSPIAPGGRASDAASFRLAALGRGPFGRGRVKLEWEVKPLGQSFDGIGTSQNEWADTGTTGAHLNELVTSLTVGPSHWRMRLLYDPIASPYQNSSRWFTMPWNGWHETDLTFASYLGGQVWEDLNEDGIMQSGEPRLSAIAVQLLDDTGSVMDTLFTAADGTYRYEAAHDESYRLRFVIPGVWQLTAQNQGSDDLVDSDADPVTGETALIVPPLDAQDSERWSAGVQRACMGPTASVSIDDVGLTDDGNNNPLLNFQDPNPSSDVTGYNVYRSADAGLVRELWPRIGDGIVDIDPSKPNLQWVDTSGDPSPTGIWFYQLAAENDVCAAGSGEGPW